MEIDKKENPIIKTELPKPNRKTRRANKAKQRRKKDNFDNLLSTPNKNTNEWDELYKQYENISGLFAPIKLTIDLVKQKQLYLFLKPAESLLFKDYVRILSKDVKAYDADIKATFELHKDKRGGCSIEDYSQLLAIGNTYADIATYYQGSTLPVLEDLTELIIVAEKRKKEHEKEIKEQLEKEGIDVSKVAQDIIDQSNEKGETNIIIKEQEDESK